MNLSTIFDVILCLCFCQPYYCSALLCSAHASAIIHVVRCFCVLQNASQGCNKLNLSTVFDVYINDTLIKEDLTQRYICNYCAATRTL